MNYYKVQVKLGHVGRNKFLKKWIPVKAETKKEASDKVKMMPRVKHHNKNVILDLVKITLDEYSKLLKVNSDDPYFKVHNSTDQRRYCKFDLDEICHEEEKFKFFKSKSWQYKRNEYIKKEVIKVLKNKEYYD